MSKVEEEVAPRVFTQTHGVVGALLEREGKFLLVKEAWGTAGHGDLGKWNQPAGWIDLGQSPIEAVKKEVKEETGYDFEPENLLGVYSLARRDLSGYLGGKPGYPHGIKLIFAGRFSGSAHAGNEEISEVEWFSPQEIEAMGPETLRDMDIKQIVRDYLSGRRFPLEIIRHTVAK